MATTDLKFWDGSSWVSVGSVAGDLIRLPVASADGESQVNGADGLISIENTTPGGEAGMTFVTADDGTRWKANVVEGLNAGRLTFYNAANEAVFTLEQNGNVILEQGTGGAGTSATTKQFVESLMNTFPLLDEGRNADGDVISPVARIDTDRDTNIKEIYFGIGGSMQSPTRILTIRTGPENDELHITAHEDYTPTDPQDLVTLSYMQDNGASGTLPISSADETVTLASLAQKSFSVQVGDKGNLSSQLTVDQVAVRINQGTSVSTIIVTATADQPVSWIRFNGSDAPGFFGYEQSTEKFRILNDTSTGSAFEFETNTGNLNVTGQVQTNTITTKATAVSDCILKLGTNLDIFCGISGSSDASEKRAQFRAAVDNSGVMVIGTPASGTTPSIPGISIHNDKNTITSQQQLRFVGVGGANDYSYVGKTADAFSVVDNDLIFGGAFYVGTDHGDAVFFSKDSELVFATGGLQASKERLRITATDIKAQDDYEPQTDNSLVTKGWAAVNTRLPARGDDAGGNDFRVEYLDRHHNAEGVQEVDPANPSCIRLGVFGGLVTTGVTRAGTFLVDGLGRLLASQSGYNSSQKPARSMMMGLYSATDIGNTRTGVALRGFHYGDVPEGSTQQGVAYTYGFYSSPNYQDLKATTAIDYIAVGPSGSLDPDSGESLTNGSVQTAVGFQVPSNFGSYIKHPLGGNPITQGFRSDLAIKEDKNQYAIFVNGSAPSRFNSDIQLTANCAITTAVETDAKLTIAGGTVKISDGSYTGLILENESTGSVIGFRSADNTTYYVGMSSAFGFQVIDTDGTSPLITHSAGNHSFYKADSTAVMLNIQDDRIRAASNYEPDNDADLTTKKYCDDAIGQAIAGNQPDETIAEGTPTNQNDPDSAPGSIMFDDSFLYLKTSVLGWRKVPLMSLNAGSAVASVTVQMTQAQYNALGTKDPNTLYVIVG